MLDQTVADNVQQAGDATANAGFQTAQYAATVTAMTALGAGLTSGPSNTPVPWAQFEVQQAIAQQAAWNSTLDVSYLAWQQQASAAYSAYAASQAQAYAASAADIAARNYANAVYAAGRTQQEAVAVAGAEYTFDMSLAGLVSQYRQNRAQADYAWANDPGYVKAFGSAVHQEMNALIESEQAAGNLPKDMVTNTGVSQPDYNLPNNYKP